MKEKIKSNTENLVDSIYYLLTFTWVSFAVLYNDPSSPLGDSRRGSNRKLIGMRYLFQPLGEHLSLLEKAKIWVTRHDHKYFVGWAEEQLDTVDTVLRPMAPITSDMYKLHMNRCAIKTQIMITSAFYLHVYLLKVILLIDMLVYIVILKTLFY